MSTQTEITRLLQSRNTIRTKMVELNLAESTDLLDTLATKISNIANQGTVNAQVQEGDSYTILPGYYAGGTVSGVAGGGNYQLQEKTGITPTKQPQTITSDAGYYGLSSVQINAIPNNFQDVSSVTATASDVLANKIIVTSDGTVTAGTMTNNNTVSKVIDTQEGNTSYTIPQGYHSGSGTVSLVTQQKQITPTTESQIISADTGKVLSQVTVNAIPLNYVDTSDATAQSDSILIGESAYVNGIKVDGTMPNNGQLNSTLDTTTSQYSIPLGYTSGGTINIELEEKTATPTTSEQSVTPTSGKVLSKVTIDAIPNNYANTSDATVSASQILDGYIAYGNLDGSAIKLTGTMMNNGQISGQIDGLSVTSYEIPSGYTSGGMVSLTNDIEEQLALI